MAWRDWPSNDRTSHRMGSIEKAVLKNFTIFIGKHPCWNTVAGLKACILLKRDSNTGFFLWTLRNFQEHLFWRRSANGCFWNALKAYFICFNVSSLKIIKNGFYLILKALFVIKIFKFLSWSFGLVEETAWIEIQGQFENF